jgi:hypothetical protein
MLAFPLLRAHHLCWTSSRTTSAPDRGRGSCRCWQFSGISLAARSKLAHCTAECGYHDPPLSTRTHFRAHTKGRHVTTSVSTERSWRCWQACRNIKRAKTLILSHHSRPPRPPSWFYAGITDTRLDWGGQCWPGQCEQTDNNNAMFDHGHRCPSCELIGGPCGCF